MLDVVAFGAVIDAHVNGPCRKITQQHGAEASIHALESILFDYGSRCANQSAVHYSCVWLVSGQLLVAEGSLSLKLGLDDIEGAGDNA